MKALWLGVYLALLCAVPAQAEEAAAPDPNKQYRDNKSLQLLCRQTAAHIPWDDVTYKGGLDAQGNFIVAADLGTPFASFEYPIDIPIQLDVLQKFNMDVPIGIIADADIAGIKIYEDGTVKYNGQDVTHDVGVFCRDRMVDPALVEAAQKAAEDAKAKGPEGGIQKEELGAPIAGEAH